MSHSPRLDMTEIADRIRCDIFNTRCKAVVTEGQLSQLHINRNNNEARLSLTTREMLAHQTNIHLSTQTMHSAGKK